MEVTFNAPRFVAPVTVNELTVASPEVDKVERLAAPVTVSVPATVVLPAGLTQKTGVPVLF